MVIRISASHVGVITTEPAWSRGGHEVPCDRCGAPRVVHGKRKPAPLCTDCRSSDPNWGTVPFEDLPTSDSNVCAFDEHYDNPRNVRRRIRRALRAESEGTCSTTPPMP